MRKPLPTSSRSNVVAKDIRRVAERARVSCATVSRVTNGVASVDKRLARRVWDAIEEIGYVPNSQARALGCGHSRTLGLLVSKITNPFFSEFIESFEDIAFENDFEVMVGSSDHNLDRAKLFIKRLLHRRVEGVAVMNFGVEPDLLAELIKQQIPLVTIDVSLNTPRSLVLEIDYLKGFNQAIQHLAVLGHRRIAFAGGSVQTLTNFRRKDAFIRAASFIGLAVDESWVFDGDPTFEGGTQAAYYFLDAPVRPTAIVCSSDIMAAGVMRVLAHQHIAVPDNMSVVGFDDFHFAAFATPKLTTVRLSREELARSALKAMQSIIGSEMSPPHGPIRVGTSLVVRESTDFHAEAIQDLNLKPRVCKPETNDVRLRYPNRTDLSVALESSGDR